MFFIVSLGWFFLFSFSSGFLLFLSSFPKDIEVIGRDQIQRGVILLAFVLGDLYPL